MEISTITSMMGALLIGMGIDYGIQIITNFGMYLDNGLSPVEALRETFTKAGIGTLLAAATTATGFFVLAATGTKAVAQFGLVAGMGILCCYLAMTIILPAMLIWFAPKTRKTTSLPKINYDFLASIAEFMSKRKWLTTIMAVVITSVLFVAMLNLGFEYDMMKLEPQQMISIKTTDKILDKFGLLPINNMVSCRNLEEAEKLTKQLEEEPMIGEVRSISQFLPSPEEQEARLEEIAKLHNMGHDIAR